MTELQTKILELLHSDAHLAASDISLMLGKQENEINNLHWNGLVLINNPNVVSGGQSDLEFIVSASACCASDMVHDSLRAQQVSESMNP